MSNEIFITELFCCEFSNCYCPIAVLYIDCVVCH